MKITDNVINKQNGGRCKMERVKRICIHLLIIVLAINVFSVTAYSEENDTQQVVTVGYFESRDFTEGARDGAVKSGFGYDYIQKIASYTGWRYQYVYGTFDELMSMLTEGKIDMLCGVLYDEIRKEKINYSSSEMTYSPEGKPYYLCTTKSRTDLQEEIDDALERMLSDDYLVLDKLKNKNYNYNRVVNKITQEEKQWAKEHGVIKLGYVDNYLPYSDMDEYGEVTGIIKDVMSTMLVNMRLDDIVSVEYTCYDSTEEMMIAVQNGSIDAGFPYGGSFWYAEQNGIVQTSSVAEAGISLVYKGEYSEDKTARMAVNKNNLLQYYYIMEKYPDSEILLYDSVEECLDAVKKGVVDSSMLNAMRSGAILSNTKYESLKSHQLSDSYDMCFAVKSGNSVLVKLLNHGIEAVGPEYGMKMTYNYTDELYHYSVKQFIRDHIQEVIAAFFIVIVIMILYYIRRSEQIRKQALADKKKERELTEALEAAQHANKAKTTFLNNMSHDIRTPMNAIIGFTSLAATHIDNTEQVKDYLSKIMASSNHLLSLINDMLDMSRIESGYVKINENECHLSTIMHDLRNILQSDVRAKRLDFFIDTVDVVDEDIICDKLRLNQILINCMGNAIKFTGPGGTVGIRIIQKADTSDGKAHFDFVIKDNGIGMSEEFVAHMFEPFTREESSTVSGVPGTGLGMSITKYIVDMMGGKISVKSKKDIGTEITISLAFKLGNNPRRVKVIKNLVGLRALVADDSMDTCVSVSRMLESIGMTAEWTMSGKEAVYKAKYAHEDGKPYKAFIIDWLMTDMNGVEVVRRIRGEIGDDTPIIILTAYDWSDIEQEARAAGVTAFCAKPIFLSDLYGVLCEKVENNSGHDAEEEMDMDFTGKRVLLVEDNELNMEIATEIIGRTGVRIDTATDGNIAVDMFKASAPGTYDMIFMDIQMPVMDGYEATRQIRNLDREDAGEVPIVAMTANAFVEDKQISYDAGMNEHTSKPIEIKDLYRIMRKYLS